MPLEGLAITEIMYHAANPPSGAEFADDDFEFLELRNVGGQPLNLSKISLTDGIEFDFASGSIQTLLPGAYALVVSNQAAFESRYGEGKPIAGVYTGNLNNAGETIAIADIFGTTLLSLTYSDEWFAHTDGGGFSLTRIDEADAAGDLSQKSAWRPSDLSGGTPGAGDVALAPGSIIVNELLANSSGVPGGDWIELRNTTGAPLDIGH